ncbi:MULTISPECIES: methyltransferase domain-containing protein [unclassified Agromyces]|uniref:methyltransferase domain-containing protein n=1 Tax=unclassified Agromyces TaxID=2639701 RepID=UPI00301476BD
MEPCCGPPNPDAYDAVFDRRFAARVARRYGARGPSGVERRLLEFLVDSGIEGATVLEIGGGVGELQLELLARGAARTVNLELSHEYEADATRLLTAAGVQDRVTRLVGVDVATDPVAVDSADIVVLNRVVCCYPDAERLLAAAAGRAKRTLAYSHPRRNWFTRARVALENRLRRESLRGFRAYIHRPEAMLDAVRGQGFAIVRDQRGLAWSTVGALRMR